MSGTRVALTALLELRRRGGLDGGRGAVRWRRPGRRRHPALAGRRAPARSSQRGHASRRRAGPGGPPAWRRARRHVGPASTVEGVDAQRAGGEAVPHRAGEALLVARRDQALREGVRRRVVADHHGGRDVVGQSAEAGQHLLGIGPVESRRRSGARADRSRAARTARPWPPCGRPATRARPGAGGRRFECRAEALRPTRRTAARARWRRAAPAGPAPGRSRRRPEADRPPSWRGAAATACGRPSSWCHQPRSKAACRRADGPLDVGLGDDARGPDGRGRDHVDVDLLVGQRLEHGGGDARVRLHARPRRARPGPRRRRRSPRWRPARPRGPGDVSTRRAGRSWGR